MFLPWHFVRLLLSFIILCSPIVEHFQDIPIQENFCIIRGLDNDISCETLKF